MIRKMFCSIVLMTATYSAFAGSCPVLMGEVDVALSDPAVEKRIGADRFIEAQSLRREGENAHKAGNHVKSEQALKRAKKTLGVK